MIPAAEPGGGPVAGDEFAALMAGLGGFEPEPRLAVAVSGGADSLALCLLCHEWARARGGEIWALTVDHRLRLESTAEAVAVGHRLREHGIASVLLTWDGPKPATGLQEAARAARYRLLIDRAAGLGVLHLLLAHHREDQAETLLLRLARGSGADGLAGMAAVRELPHLRLLRPLLGLPKARLVATCRAAGVAWHEDPSNRAPAFARARLRAGAGTLAALGLTPEALAASARRLGRLRAALDLEVAAVLGRCAAFDPGGFVWLEPAPLAAVSEEIGCRVLARILAAVGRAEPPPRHERLLRLAGAIPAGLDRGRTLAGCRILPHGPGGRLLVVREPAAVAAPVPLFPGRAVGWDRRFQVRLAAGKDGDDAGDGDGAGGGVFVGALGERGWAGLREGIGDAVRRRVPEPARAGLPALWDREGLLAVPHLGFRRRGGGRDRAVVAEILFVPAMPAAAPSFAVAWAKPGII